MADVKELFKMLNRRIQRLQEEININAPKLIIKTELLLIKDACDKLLKKFEINF